MLRKNFLLSKLDNLFYFSAVFLNEWDNWRSKPKLQKNLTLKLMMDLEVIQVIRVPAATRNNTFWISRHFCKATQNLKYKNKWIKSLEKCLLLCQSRNYLSPGFQRKFQPRVYKCCSPSEYFVDFSPFFSHFSFIHFSRLIEYCDATATGHSNVVFVQFWLCICRYCLFCRNCLYWQNWRHR